MFPKENRLRKTKEFSGVFANGKGVKEGRLLLKAKTSRNGITRFGIIVGKNVQKKAVGRNRIRRLLNQVLREEQNNIQQGYDIVLLALPGFALESIKDARAVVDALLLKAKLLKH